MKHLKIAPVLLEISNDLCTVYVQVLVLHVIIYKYSHEHIPLWENLNWRHWGFKDGDGAAALQTPFFCAYLDILPLWVTDNLNLSVNLRCQYIAGHVARFHFCIDWSGTYPFISTYIQKTIKAHAK